MTKDEAILRLREWFPKGSTVYTIVRHVSKSGMSRTVGVLALHVDGGKIIDLHPNYAVHVALGWRLATGRYDGVVVRGCGMDMGYHLAHTLASVLYGDGYALKHQWL